MLGIYRQSLSKIKSKKIKEDKYTGHEKYTVKKTGFRRKRRKCGVKESKSATEIHKKTSIETSFKSASYDQMQEMENWNADVEGGVSPTGNKMESLAKLFSCVTVSQAKDDFSSYR